MSKDSLYIVVTFNSPFSPLENFVKVVVSFLFLQEEISETYDKYPSLAVS